MEHPTTIAVDLAKSVFEVAVSKEPGRVCQRRRLTRSQMAAFFVNRPAATVLMESCGTAHFWGRLLRGVRPPGLALHTQAEDTIAVATLPQPAITRAPTKQPPASPAPRPLATGVQIRLLDSRKFWDSRPR